MHLARYWLALPFVFLLTTAGCSCGDPGTDRNDGGTQADAGGGQAPVVTIVAPAAGASFPAGTSIDFEGTAQDAEDGAITAEALAWSSDLDGQLGLGGQVTTALASEGAHLITLTATDADGNSASASITITVTPSDLPLVTITSPDDGHEAAIGESVRFDADVVVPAGADVPNGAIVWTSSLDGRIGLGAQIRTGLATEGAHTITCTATTTTGRIGTASIVVNVVGNHAPRVTLASPEEGAYYKPDQSIAFAGSAQDQEDGTLTGASLVWSSDGVGQIGIGAQVATALPLGVHVITLTATDSQGAVGSASVTVRVVDNIPPRCEINEPGDGDSFFEGQSVVFQGACTDAESGALTAGLIWTSDVDGQLGLGANVQTALASTGSHLIRLCAADPVDASLEGCAEVAIEVVANTAPTCAITGPVDGAVVVAGEALPLRAEASDAEDPSLTGQGMAFEWSSDRRGVLATTRNASVTFTAAESGDHQLTFTATDSGGLVCTARVSIFVNQPPTVSIDLVTQGGSAAQPFDTASAIDFAGSGADPEGEAVSLDWRDSLFGDFGTGAAASLAAPLMGRHLVTLTGTDPRGASGTDVTEFTVLPPGQLRLVEPYAAVNAMLMGQSLTVRALASSSDATVYLGNGNREVYTFDGDSLTTVASRALSQNQLPDQANQILLDEASGLLYVATVDGLVVCSWSSAAGIDAASCQVHRDGDLPNSDNDLQAVVRITGSDGNDYLLLGNSEGLLVADDPSGSATGTVALGGRDVRGLAADGTRVWVATDGDGLYRFDPVTGQSQNWDAGDGAPSDNLRAVAVGHAGAAIWVGSDNGLGRFEPATGTWTVWRAGGAPAPGLVANVVHALAIHRVSIAGTPRDVVWVGTGGGVSRLDPTIPSFMDLTTADGLPSNAVRALTILPDGTKVFGTSGGVARYTGP